MAQTKTDNDFLRDKMELRISRLPAGPVSVLDCFGGYGVLWDGVKQHTGRGDIKRLPIDKRDDDIGFHLHGDNRDFLTTLDLSRFNIIDLDAYGTPYEQLKIIFKRGYIGIVFATFIQTAYGQLPFGLLGDLGFSEEMIKKTPTLFGRRGWDYFLQWLALNGVSEVYHRSNKRKHYMAFTVSGAGEPAGGYDNRLANTAASLS